MNIEILKAVIMGVVQGITEFFPISSTAHLILFPWFFSWSGALDTLTFDVALHSGTLVSLLACFYREWLDLLLRDRRTLLFILLATLPAGVAGVLLKDFVEHTFRNPLLIVGSLVCFGVLMLVAERRGRRLKTELSFADAMVVGVAQAIALVPGVSRSGITITAGLFRNVKREAAARFSFLLSTPVIAGATLFEGRRLFSQGPDAQLDIFAVGFAAAFVSGYFAIKFLLAFLKKHPLNAFIYYRFLLAAIIVVVWLRQ